MFGYLWYFFKEILASERECVLRDPSIFWIKFNNLHKLYFGITTFSNHKNT